jgi:hypothetical protein
VDISSLTDLKEYWDEETEVVTLKESIHVNLLLHQIDKVDTLYVWDMNWSNSTKEWEMVGSSLAQKWWMHFLKTEWRYVIW